MSEIPPSGSGESDIDRVFGAGLPPRKAPTVQWSVFPVSPRARLRRAEPLAFSAPYASLTFESPKTVESPKTYCLAAVHRTRFRQNSA